MSLLVMVLLMEELEIVVNFYVTTATFQDILRVIAKKNHAIHYMQIHVEQK